MPEFYFTYGSSKNFPFVGGWTKVTAPSINIALNVFTSVHPNVDGCMNCANYYTEKQFLETKMSKNGNFGFFEHEHITMDINYPQKENDR